MALTSRKEKINSLILYFSIFLFIFLSLYIICSYCFVPCLFFMCCLVSSSPIFVSIFLPPSPPPCPPFCLCVYSLIFSHLGFITGVGIFLARSFACYGFNPPLDISSPLFGPCHILCYCLPHPVTHCS